MLDMKNLRIEWLLIFNLNDGSELLSERNGALRGNLIFLTVEWTGLQILQAFLFFRIAIFQAHFR